MTIVVLIILATISINIVFGEDGILEIAKQTKEEQRIAEIKEKLNVAKATVFINKKGILTLEDYQAQICDIEKIVSSVSEISQEGENRTCQVTTEDGYTFKIIEIKENNSIDLLIEYNKKGNIIPEVEKNNKILSYSVKNNSKNINKVKYTKLMDSTENQSDGSLNNINLTNDKDGIIFDGTSSYIEINKQVELTFPLTLEIIITAVKRNEHQIIFTDPDSGVAFGIHYYGYFACSGTNGKTYTIPSDFYDGNKKHIIVTYNSKTDYEVYVDGNKLVQNSASNYWYLGSSTYIGRRTSGTYLSGTLYEFNIYDRILSEEEITSSINNDTGLILKYTIGEESLQYEYVPDTLKDMSNNGNDATLYETKYNEENDGLIFDGTSSYGIINFQEPLIFPKTISIVAKVEADSSIIFTDYDSTIGIGTWQSKYIILQNKNSKVLYYELPADFYTNEKNYIYAIYSSKDEYELYINGNKIEGKKTIGNGWCLNEANTYLGRRNAGTYFKGTLYQFEIYDELFSETQIMNKYNEDRAFFEVD